MFNFRIFNPVRNLIVITLFILAGNYESGHAQRHGENDSAVNQTDKKAAAVTITGCMTSGRDCYIFHSSDQKHVYAIPKSDDLKVGNTYKIVGRLTDAPNTCGDYLQMIVAETIKNLDQECKDMMGGVPGNPKKP